MPNSSASLPQAESEPTRPSSAQQPGLPTGPTHIATRSTQTRASNVARAALIVADVTPTGYNVGVFMADHARYAKPADIRRNVQTDEIFTYWPQAKIAAAMGCSERQVRRGVRSLREAGVMDVRRRVRPCEASYVWVLPVRSDVRSESAGVLSGVRSDVLSGVLSHTEPRTEPQNNHGGSSRAREVCKICGNNWPAEYGTACHKCPQPTPSELREQRNKQAGDEFERKLREETPTGCTCGDAYRQSYERRCIDCEGEPSVAQRDAAREQDAYRGVDDRGGSDGGGSDSPSVPQTETRQPPETRRQSSEDSVLPEHAIPPDGGEGEDEPPPKADHDALRRWWEKEQARHGRKRTPLQHRSERRRLARALRKEQADLAIGVDA